MGFINQFMGGGAQQTTASQTIALGFSERRPPGTPFPRTLTKADFQIVSGSSGIGNADVTVTAGVFNELGRFTVQAQTFATFGQNASANFPENQGKWFVDLEDTGGADMDGLIRLSLRNAQGTTTRVITEQRTEVLSENATDTTKQIHLPETQLWVGEDSQLLLEFQPDSAPTLIVDTNETNILIDVTIYQ